LEILEEFLRTNKCIKTTGDNMKFSTDGTYSLNVRFENLTEAQALAIEELLATWQFIGDTGEFSIWTGFWTDSKIDWNPKITVNGEEPKRFMKDIGLREGRVKMLQHDDSEIIQRMYFCDYFNIEDALEREALNGSTD
jgi:hypothetical protein